MTVSSGPLSALASYSDIFVTFKSRTLRLVGEYTHHVREIADTRKDKEQHADTFGTLSAVIEKELGNARAKIKGGAKVAKYLTPNVEVKRRGCIICRR